MEKKKKEYKMVSYRADVNVIEQLQEYHEKTGITITRIVEDALKEFLKDK